MMYSECIYITIIIIILTDLLLILFNFKYTEACVFNLVVCGYGI